MAVKIRLSDIALVRVLVRDGSAATLDKTFQTSKLDNSS